MKSLINNRTVKALIARGLPSDDSIGLYRSGFTLSKLKCMTKDELLNLGLNEEVSKTISNEPRPSIPQKTISKLLFDSRYTCCVCRNREKPIIIHHIEPWEESRSHDIKNLVVLCLEHHDEAHSKRELSISLTADKIRKMKEEWLEKVKELDKEVVLDAIEPKEWFEVMSVCWDYFNINRIYELADNLNINIVDSNKYFLSLYRQGYVDKNGMLISSQVSKYVSKDSLYWLDFMGGTLISYFYKETMRKIIGATEIVILNDIWTKPQIESILRSGNIVFIQGAFYFRQISKCHIGKNQSRIAYRQAKEIKLEFQFNPWHCVSGSSHYNHLTGRKVATVIAIVRSVTRTVNGINIRCSCLGIGTGLNNVYNGRFDYDRIDFEEYEEDELFVE